MTTIGLGAVHRPDVEARVGGQCGHLGEVTFTTAEVGHHQQIPGVSSHSHELHPLEHQHRAIAITLLSDADQHERVHGAGPAVAGIGSNL